jgi:hypothetical protein
VIGRLDVARRNRACCGHDVRRDISAARECLGRRKAGARDRASIPDQLQPNEPRFLLEHKRIADGAAINLAEPREYESGADVRMAGEGKLGAGRENTDFGRVRRIPRRQDECRLGQIEFGGDRLHLRRCQSLRIGDDGQRIAPEPPVGEDVDRHVGELHAMFRSMMTPMYAYDRIGSHRKASR